MAQGLAPGLPFLSLTSLPTCLPVGLYVVRVHGVLPAAVSTALALRLTPFLPSAKLPIGTPSGLLLPQFSAALRHQSTKVACSGLNAPRWQSHCCNVLAPSISCQSHLSFRQTSKTARGESLTVSPLICKQLWWHAFTQVEEHHLLALMLSGW